MRTNPHRSTEISLRKTIGQTTYQSGEIGQKVNDSRMVRIGIDAQHNKQGILA